MTVSMSGFTRAGDPQAVLVTLTEREELKITLMARALLGNDVEKTLAEAGVLSRRLPFQTDPALRKAINAGEVMFAAAWNGEQRIQPREEPWTEKNR
jgi:succinyl-CoA:acetate CoA-transferase